MKFKHLTAIAAILLTTTSAFAQKQNTPIQLFLAGDSTMSIKADNKRPETGWGEMLPSHLRDNVLLHNRAINGRSTKSFKAQGHWQKIVDELNPGDYVFIQFGHNDQKSNDPLRYTNAYTSYRDNLRQFVEDVRSRQATPILLSSIARRNFNEHDVLVDSHGIYAEVVRQVAHSTGVTFIDMTLLTERVIETMGKEQSQALYLHLKPGENSNYPQGVEDNTHLNQAGAKLVANIVVEQLCKAKTDLRHWFLTCSD